MPRPTIDVRSRLIAIVLPEEADFSTRALAHLLGIDNETVHRASQRGELPKPVQRFRYRWVYQRADLVAFQRGSVKS